MKRVMFKQDFSNFDNLNFHDCQIYALGFDKSNYELLIDIDLITDWIEEKNSYSFILFPSTLVFENVWDIEIDISMDGDLIIDSISRQNPKEPKNIAYLPPTSLEYEWVIDTLQGQIRFKSIELKIYKRNEEKRQKSQTLSFNQRDFISLKKDGNIIFPAR